MNSAIPLAPDKTSLRWRLNRHYRQVATGFCFAVFGIAGIVFGVTLYPLVALTTLDRATAKRRAQYLTHIGFRVFSHLMRAVGVISWEIHGAEKLQKQGQLIIANHPTLIDVVLLIGHTRKVDCIVKAALFKNPFTQLVVSQSGYIPNGAPEQLLKDAVDSMQAGNSLMIFPEGTRSVPGQPLHIPHSVARLALEANVPVLPVTITCNPIMLMKHTPFYKVPDRPGHFVITVGKPYSVQPWLDDAPNRSIAARRLARHWEAYFTERCGAPPKAGK